MRIRGFSKAVLVLALCTEVVGDLFKVAKLVDESVYALNHLPAGNRRVQVRSVSRQIEKSREYMYAHGLHSSCAVLHEVVCYLDLACFSLLELDGDSFDVYMHEINNRYRVLSKIICRLENPKNKEW